MKILIDNAEEDVRIRLQTSNGIPAGERKLSDIPKKNSYLLWEVVPGEAHASEQEERDTGATSHE